MNMENRIAHNREQVDAARVEFDKYWAEAVRNYVQAYEKSGERMSLKFLKAAKHFAWDAFVLGKFGIDGVWTGLPTGEP